MSEMFCLKNLWVVKNEFLKEKEVQFFADSTQDMW
jgi:hypothetical protein